MDWAFVFQICIIVLAGYFWFALWAFMSHEKEKKDPALPEGITQKMVAALEEGRLFIVPCRPGSYVWDIEDGTPYRTRVLSFTIHDEKFGVRMSMRTVSGWPNCDEIGTRIFLTPEEAMEALAEQSDGN